MHGYGFFASNKAPTDMASAAYKSVACALRHRLLLPAAMARCFQTAWRRYGAVAHGIMAVALLLTRWTLYLADGIRSAAWAFLCLYYKYHRRRATATVSWLRYINWADSSPAALLHHALGQRRDGSWRRTASALAGVLLAKRRITTWRALASRQNQTW